MEREAPNAILSTCEPDDTERYEKQMKDLQDKIKESKDKTLPDLLNKGNEAKDKAKKALDDAADESAKKMNELEEKLNQISEERDGQEKAATAEIAGIRQQMDAVDKQIRELEMSKLNSELKYGEAKTQLDLQCNASASQQVAKNQMDKMGRIKKARLLVTSIPS